jgi:hypothetical protein
VWRRTLTPRLAPIAAAVVVAVAAAAAVVRVEVRQCACCHYCITDNAFKSVVRCDHLPLTHCPAGVSHRQFAFEGALHAVVALAVFDQPVLCAVCCGLCDVWCVVCTLCCVLCDV